MVSLLTFKVTYTESYNLSLELNLSRDIVATASYVGNTSRHLNVFPLQTARWRWRTLLTASTWFVRWRILEDRSIPPTPESERSVEGRASIQSTSELPTLSRL